MIKATVTIARAVAGVVANRAIFKAVEFGFFIRFFLKLFSDSTYLSDEKNIHASKEIADSYTAADLHSMQYRSVFNDNGSMADADIKSTNKLLINASIFADTGSLLSQGYCDFSYFAEDYVGEFRAFT